MPSGSDAALTSVKHFDNCYRLSFNIKNGLNSVWLASFYELTSDPFMVIHRLNVTHKVYIFQRLDEVLQVLWSCYPYSHGFVQSVDGQPCSILGAG